MKRITALLLIILCIIPLTTLTSCGKPSNKPISKSNVQSILNNRYGKDFTCVSEDLKSDGSGTYTFEDNDGVQFTVTIDKCFGELGNSWYRQSENYPLEYYKAHPELFEDFNKDGHHFDVESHTMYFDSFNDIDETAQFVCNKVNQMECLNKDNSDSVLNSNDFCIIFKPADSKYADEISRNAKLWITGNTKREINTIRLANSIKYEYVHALRFNNDTEEISKLTNEQLYSDPLRSVSGITYNGEKIIDYMYYTNEEGSSGYTYTAYFNSPDTKYNSASLEKLLKHIGWNVEFKNNTVTISNVSDTLIIDKANAQLNGEPYELDGSVFYSPKNDQYDSYYSVLFTEKDFRDLFGIEFYFDQLKGTGEITKLGN